MNNVLDCLAIAVLIGLAFYEKKALKNGLVWYCICLYLMPVLVIGGNRISFDIVAFPILLVIFTLKKYSEVLLTKSIVLFSLYFVLYCCLTLFSGSVYEGDFSFATAYAIIRFVLTIMMISDEFRDETIFFVDRVLKIVMPIELLFALLQITKILDVSFFYNLYYKASLAPLLGQMRMGDFDRAYGAAGSPIILGGIASLAFAYYFGVYFIERNKIHFVVPKIVISLVCGLLALSKTAILSIPLIAILVLALNWKRINPQRAISFFFTVVLSYFVIDYVITYLDSLGLAIQRYLAFLSDPFSALDTRYDSSSGNLSKAIEIIRNHFIIGVGNSQMNNAFIGDSVYIVLLYETGLIGLVAYFLPFVRIIIISIKKHQLICLPVLFAILLIAVGNAMHLSYFIVIYVALFVKIVDYDSDAPVSKENIV